MTISTTVSLNNKHRHILTATALNLGIARNKLIEHLFRMSIPRMLVPAMSPSRVRHQKRSTSERVKPLSVSFSPIAYEQYQDIRKVGKFSVSFFLAMAIEKFLDELILMMTTNQFSTNKYGSCYIIHVEFNENILMYTVSHEKPPE